MNILIIGGTGFISSRLTQMLLKRGHKISLFTRGRSASPFPENERIRFYHGDRNNGADLANAVYGKTFDVVYDMVAYDARDSLEAVKIFKGRCGRFIHCSTVSVYMISDQLQCPVTEDQWQNPPMPDFPRNPFGHDYGIKKRQCEEVLWQNHDDRLFPVSMLRPPYVCGPGDPAKRDWFWIERLLDGKPLIVPGSGDFAFQSVFVDDVAAAFMRVPEKNQTAGQAYNIAGNEIFSLKDYLRTLGNLLNVQPEIITVDQEWFDKQDISIHPQGDVFTFNTQRTAVFSLDKIKKDIDFNSTPFREWMLPTIDWFLNIYKCHSTSYERRDSEMDALARWKNHNNEKS